MLNQGGQSQQFPQSSGAPPHSRPPQFIPTQPSNVNMPNQPQLNQYTPSLVDQKGEQQQDQSPSLKKPESVANEFGPNFNQVKPETGVNDDRKTGNVGEGEALTKDAVSDLHQVQDSVTTQRVKEETKDGASDYNKSEDATVDSMKQEADNDRTQIGDVSGGFPIKGTEQSSHEQVPNMHSGQQQRPAAPALLPAHHNAGQPPSHGFLPPGPHPGDHFQPPGPNNFSNNSRGYEPQSAGSHGQYNQSQSHARPPRMSQGEPLGPPPLPYGPDGQTVPRHPVPMEPDMYQNQRPSHFDTRRPDPHLHDRGPFGVESNSMRMNGAPPPPGHDSSSAPVFRDEKFRNPDSFPTRYHDGSPKFGSHSSRPLSGYGMDGPPPPPRFVDKDPHGHGYHPFDAPPSGFLPPGRPLHDDNRGRFEHNRPNPDFHGPMHGFGRSPGKRSFGGHGHGHVDDREMDRHSFGERFGPPGHMHRGEFDGPGKPPFGLRNRDPGFGSFHDYGRSGDPGFSFGPKSGRPHLGEPGFRSSYSRQGFPGDGEFFPGGSDSFDGLRKRKTYSMGWCRICKIDCESVEGLDMHGQTREHQRMAMDMVISIKQKSKKQKTSNDHSGREEPGKLRNSENHARVNVS